MSKKIKSRIIFTRETTLKKIDESADVTQDNLSCEISYSIDGVNYMGVAMCQGKNFEITILSGFEPVIEKVGNGNKKAQKRIAKSLEELTDVREKIYNALLKSNAFIFSDFENLVSYGQIDVEVIIEGKQVLAETYIDISTEENYLVHYLVDIDIYETWKDEDGKLIVDKVEFNEDMIYMVQRIEFEDDEV